MLDTAKLLNILQVIEKRAERIHNDEHTISTYVENEILTTSIAARDNGVIYGRRGTGKTHTLKYLAEKERAKGNLVVFIDVKQDLGSTGGWYSDSTIPLAERASRLLVDIIAMIQDSLINDALNGHGDLHPLNEIFDHIGEVMVVEQEEQEIFTGREKERSEADDLKVSVGKSGLSMSAGVSDRSLDKSSESVRIKSSGGVRYRVHFGALGKLFKHALEAHPAEQCWILLDEWSEMPISLQPYVAEMLRRIFFSLPKVTVRIAAIPHRTEWRILREGSSDYIGIEIGSDLFPILDLDEFVIFPAKSKREQKERSINFFQNLLFRHINQELKSQNLSELDSLDQLTTLLFTQITALQELIRAAEGVPRDALSIISKAAIIANDEKISTNDIRQGAHRVYKMTKAALLSSAPEARKLLDAIIGEVISKKKARAFLLNQDHVDHPLIRRLIDDRILHIIKKDYSSAGVPGIKFDVLQIDYGCYVHLLGAPSAPQGIFGAEGPSEDTLLKAFFGEKEVPRDDYRAIRRAQLDLPTKLEAIHVPKT
ncbi:helicase HerA-like domain-containing protein [Streptosporangium subroseum]|uniref:helicase HerA-like domain-containing protein n=1 Tax=Streptosporangium subroseum TaxID=106412 RepID=UPI0030864890|nr:DUF853 family protein [Streptosporangium subroseum]